MSERKNAIPVDNLDSPVQTGAATDLGAEMKATPITVTPPNFQTAVFMIEGIEPYVSNRFSKKAQEQIRATQLAGSTSRKGKKRDAKDFDACFQEAQHLSTEGWHGLPASAFRKAMVSACRTVGFKMTLAKLSIFIVADGYDESDTPLVKITKGEPEHVEHYVRNATSVVDLRARAKFAPGWQASVRVQYDADQFELVDVTNLLMRVGLQVGIGEGRPDSPNSTGMGWGRFKIVNPEEYERETSTH